MKKSTLLSFLTAASVIATTAGTYSTWDSITANTASKAVTFRNPVTIGIETDLNEFTDNFKNTLVTDASNLVASNSVKFKIENTDKLAQKLIIKPVFADDSTLKSFENIDIKIKNSELSELPLNGTQLSDGFYDESIKDHTTGEKEYTIEVSPKNTNVKGQEIKLKFEATLSK